MSFDSEPWLQRFNPGQLRSTDCPNFKDDSQLWESVFCWLPVLFHLNFWICCDFCGGLLCFVFSWLELHLLWRIFPNRIAGFVSMSLPLIFFVKCFVHKSPDLHGNHGFLNWVSLTLNDLVVSTHLKNISQNGSFPQSKGLKKGLKPPPRWWSSNTLMKKHAILLYCSSLIVLSSHVSF